MGALQKLFKHTFIYGLATVLPRLLNVTLTPLYTDKLPTSAYGVFSSLYVYLMLGNVLLSYGMETAFFRFMNKSERKAEVQATALTSIFISSIVFLIVGYLMRYQLASWLEFSPNFIVYVILILFLDALCVIPFAWFRNNEMPLKYSFIRILNVIINLSFNLFFFLVLPILTKGDKSSFFNALVFENEIHYIFISNLIASFITLLIVLPLYFRIGFDLDSYIWRKMFRYAFPVLIAGLAFSINEGFDKIMLKYLLPENTANSVVGIYAACYKLGMFMTLFVTAFKLGVEPFFFSNANKKNAKEIYADTTLYFTIFGTFIFLVVVTYADVFKLILIPNADYWEALWIVPFILLANLCLGIYHNLSVWYKITDKTRYGAYISVFGALLTLVFNFILIPIISYKGSAIATLIAYASMMLLSYYFGQKNHPIPYNLKKIVGYMGISILFALLSFYVFDRNLIIGTLFVLVFLMLIYKMEQNTLVKIVRALLKKNNDI
ncbi:oligosaccharide flippase family protein [Galbibacter pacificus]|uniref:Oligosaccharide flippase family protein n=1 Tax=Galbibacter pacificus TaxID=2996052 RepID=A0ABT6FU72_9FLAO|nr:oligosaccharide flippase family protein [Galbibacter pacificus]MDG3583324.1 oligosaccharide flippase family protein [Galbibacter pacificus]MDG3586805.1 oligosaccharide flippase family protein [Galbibacter pacificus]